MTVLGGIGFTAPWLLLALLALPILWFSASKLAPIILEHFSSRETNWISSKRFILNKYIDHIGYYFLILMYLVLVGLAGYSYNVHRERNIEYQVSKKYNRELSILFDEYYRDFSELGVSLDRLALSLDREKNSILGKEFFEDRDTFVAKGIELRASVQANSQSTKDLVEDFIRNSLMLERIANSCRF